VHVLHCDRCHLEFMDYIGYENIDGEGIVCMDCIVEEEEAKAEEEELYSDHKKAN
jgi:hypothetical protein